MRRTLFAAVMLAASATVTTAQQPAPPPAPGAPPAAGGQQGGARQGPRAYRDVVTSQAVTDSGVFHVHRIGDRILYEIPRSQLGRLFRFVADQRGTIRGVGYGGEQVTARIIRWDRIGNRILLRMVNMGMRADTNLPVSRAVDLSNQPPILMSFDVEAWSPDDSNAVIDVGRLFTTDVQELNLRQAGVRVRRLDPARSIVERARSFPTNIEVSALHTFEVDSVPSNSGPQYDRSTNSLTMLMNYSMLALPDRPMQPRLCDNRVGYFSTSFEDFGADSLARVPTRCFINRWRLEPQNPNAAVSDPIKPIIFYIDPATPERMVEPLIRGVRMWEPVFRAAGFSNAIDARRAPTAAQDPEFDVDDARYSTIRWLPSTIENAYGPHVSDPRTGEILQSNIGWYHNITSLLQSWYWTQVGAVDPRAVRLPFPQDLMAELVAYVSAHEVGHTLGLPHNQLSSGLYPTDSLRSPTYTRQHGTSYSIMDYARNNYVAQPGDNAALMPKIGVWDYYVINWAYRRFPGHTPQSERRILDSLARLQETQPWLRFGNPDGIDPRTQTEGLGDDPVKSTRYGIANIRRLVPMLIPATTADQLEDYDELNTMFNQVVAQWAREMGQVAVVPGGFWRTERYPGQGGAIYQPVPRERQREAVQFLIEEAFATPTYFLDAEILRRIESYGSVDRIRQRQVAILNTLLNDARLVRLTEQAALDTPDAPAYTIAEYFSDLRRGIFSEATSGRATDEFRRNLQRAFVDQMQRIISTPLQGPIPPNTPAQFLPSPRPGDARAVARLELQDLDVQLRGAAARTTDRTTRAHWADLRAQIDRVLNPR